MELPENQAVQERFNRAMTNHSLIGVPIILKVGFCGWGAAGGLAGRGRCTVVAGHKPG